MSNDESDPPRFASPESIERVRARAEKLKAQAIVTGNTKIAEELGDLETLVSKARYQPVVNEINNQLDDLEKKLPPVN